MVEQPVYTGKVRSSSLLARTKMEPTLIYEDEFILVFDKPSGLLVHPDGRSKEKTLVDFLDQNYPELIEVGEEQILQTGEKIKRPGIVHRLDKDTSGVIVVAKTKESFSFLKEQFQNRKVEKVYNAVVWGCFSDDKLKGLIDKPIGRSASDFRKWSSEYGAKGEMREAITAYQVLVQSQTNISENTDNNLTNYPYIKNSRSYKIDAEDGNSSMGFAYLEVRPKTGRTHQIRVHFKAIGHPVVGDRLYGPKMNNKSISMSYEKENLGFNRLALHSLSIKIQLPNESVITLESPLPPEFKNAKNLLKNSGR